MRQSQQPATLRVHSCWVCDRKYYLILQPSGLQEFIQKTEYAGHQRINDTRHVLRMAAHALERPSFFISRDAEIIQFFQVARILIRIIKYYL